MTITYSIAIDYDDDGTFTDLTDDITQQVLKTEWCLGMPEPYADIASVSTASITVRNNGQWFSPEISGAMIGKRIRIQSDDGTTTRTHFIGYINQVEPQAGNQGDRRAVIQALGRGRELAQQQVRLPLLTDVRADEAIEQILGQIRWRYDTLDGMCIIGRDSIGSCEIFPTVAITSTLDTGKSTFAFLADDWGDGLPADVAIEQLARGEAGRFFYTRDGELTFYNRHHLLTEDSIAATFDNDLRELDYAYGGVINDVMLTIQPREIGASNTLFWSLASPLKLLPNSSVEIIARYEIDDERVGAIEVLRPRPMNNYLANTDREGLGADVTGAVQVILLEAGLSASRLEIRNRSLNTIYLMQLDLYGTPLITGDDLTYLKSDSLSVADHGQHTLRLRLPVITDFEELDGIANWELQRRSQAQGRIQALHTDTQTHPSETLSLTLFDRIRVIESQTGHDASYHIIAEEHCVDMGGTRHRVIWSLEPSESSIFFIIGTHSIGDDSVVIVPR